jgi:hypothetical protein
MWVGPFSETLAARAAVPQPVLHMCSIAAFRRVAGPGTAQGWSGGAPSPPKLRRALLQALQPAAASSRGTPLVSPSPAKTGAPQQPSPTHASRALGDAEVGVQLQLVERLRMAPPPPPPPRPPAPTPRISPPLLSLLSNLQMYSRQRAAGRADGHAPNASDSGRGGGWPAAGAFPNLRVRFLPPRLPAKDVMVRRGSACLEGTKRWDAGLPHTSAQRALRPA